MQHDPWEENMNRHENTALLDHVRVTRLHAAPEAVHRRRAFR